MKKEDPISALMRVYNSRLDLQRAFPEAKDGDYNDLIEWASRLDVSLDSASKDLLHYQAYYKSRIASKKPLKHEMPITLSLHRNTSDIADHLPTLHLLTRELDLKRVLELGVREGNSTLALLEAVREISGHLWSIDLEARDTVKKLIVKYGLSDFWTFIQDDDLSYSWELPIDHLFIDTLHTYKHTLKELHKYEPYVSKGGIISMHDLTSCIGVSRAAQEYFSRRDVRIYQYFNCNGLIVCKKL